MANGWTPERKAKQAELIQNWQPWERSTGAKTEAGKAISAMNAYKHGLRSAEWLEDEKRVNELFRECKVFIRRVR